MTAVNDAPVEASIEGTALSYTENDGAVAITSTLTLSDADDANLESAVVQITGNYANGEDVLSFVDQNGITGSWNAATGELTLTGPATLAQYETALRSITYNNTSEDPSSATRTISFVVNDGDNNSNIQTRDIDFTAVNDAPVEAAIEGTALAYSENDAAVAITSTLTVTDVDDANIESAVVAISANYANGQDILAFVDQNGITGSWNATTGELTLTGTATIVQYEAALRSVTYVNTSDNPSEATRTVSFTVNDGDVDSNTLTRNIDITPVNDAPVESTIEGTNVAYNENDSATQITNTISIADLDDTNIESAVVQITGNYINGEDLLAFSDTGTITGAWNSVTGTMVLTGSDTLANYEAALRSITYQNVAIEPTSILTRTVSFTVNDGNVDSNVLTRDIDITPVNDNDPTITSNGGGGSAAINVAENSTYVATVSATDGDLPGETLTYSIVGGLDSAKFVIDSNSGVLRFVTSPDFEAPTDNGSNNVYDVVVEVSDGSRTDSQAIAVTVTDSVETIIFGNNSSSSTAGAASLSFAHTVDNNDHRFLIVSVAVRNDVSVSTVTYDGTDLTLVGFDVDGSGKVRSEMWAMIAPTVGMANVVVTLAGSANFSAGASDFYGVDQTVPFGSVTTGNGSGDPSLSVASAIGELVVDAVADRDVDTEMVGANQEALLIEKNGSGSGDAWVGSSMEAGAPSVTMSWTTDGAGAGEWAAVALALKPHVNTPPMITSDGGGATANVNVAENSTAVTTVTAVDGDLPAQSLTYSIVGGADAGKFTIDSGSGVLTFISAPDFESPTDAGANNIYDVDVQVSDGVDSDTQSIAVSVTNVNEAPVESTIEGTNVSLHRERSGHADHQFDYDCGCR